MWDLHGYLVPRKKRSRKKSFLNAFCYVSIIHTKILDYFEMFQKSKLYALKSTSSTEFFNLKMVNLSLWTSTFKMYMSCYKGTSPYHQE